MQDNQEGTVSLLNTIKCPRILKMIQQKLPEGKSLKKANQDSSIKNNEANLKSLESQIRPP